MSSTLKHSRHRRRCYFFMLCWLTSHAFCATEAVKVVVSEGCSQAERDALLLLKAGILNSSALLPSWTPQADCCAWSGVVCRNRTGDVRVAELNLQNPNAEQTSESDTALRGELLNPSLSSLTALRSLNLSYNDLGGAPIPAFVGSLRQLRVLDLRWCNFAGNLPPHLGNLTNLRYLDLKSNSFLRDRPRVDRSLDWLMGLSSLTYLDMSCVNLNAAAYSWVATINSLPALQQLKLFLCNLDVPPLDFQLNLTSLTTLDLSLNRFQSTFPNWLWNLTGLLSLQLGSSQLQGQLPAEIGNLISLVNLDLSLNSLLGPLRNSIWKLKHLANLDLSFNFLGDSLPMGIMNLSSLSTLNLANCSLTGPIPTELGNLTTLKNVYLGLNSLSGQVPVEIGKLLDLAQLDLSANSLRGNISEFHISNLTRLECLFLFDNPSLTLSIDYDWIPPFQLHVVDFSSCVLGGRFPGWLRSQRSIKSINLYNTGIEDTVPDWFWNSSSSTILAVDFSRNRINGSLPTSLESLTKLYYLNLASNLLQGPIPHFPPSLSLLDLSFNFFSGPLPSTLFTPHLSYLILSHNLINGRIPSSVCNCMRLERFNLSNNRIFGEIPGCWPEASLLSFIHLGNNMLSGEIPSSIGNLTQLEFLHLNDNNLSGHLPSSLQNCSQLLIVDLGDNKFSGSVPVWIGQSWLQLRALRLRSNMFDGDIAPQLRQLRDLQIVDLADNKLSGPIPASFGNFSALISTLVRPLPPFFTMFIGSGDYEGVESLALVTKGDQLIFSSILYLVKTIDLSSNNLSGEIPEELGNLAGLYTLNLSRNNFRGKIPNNIGRMTSLETLDLSLNHFSGSIPQGMSQLSYLSHLNLSYNNLSGEIPFGNQLQTLDDASIYSGNPYLCGALMNKSCSEGNNMINASSEEYGMASRMLLVYLSHALGFLVGLWSVFVVLLFKKDWRNCYFKMVDKIYDKVHVVMNRLKIRK
ncbi:uncharacterized protein LOC141847879 [Curcuma longa]|uniref:uncharacterized protein LOC141847879 n=1 Tax=Curcuma longa TaxID=136217 RepID=UPI003D9DCC60